MSQLEHGQIDDYCDEIKAMRTRLKEMVQELKEANEKKADAMRLTREMKRAIMEHECVCDGLKKELVSKNKEIELLSSVIKDLNTSDGVR